MYAKWDNDVEFGQPSITTDYSDKSLTQITGGAFGELEGSVESDSGRGRVRLPEQSASEEAQLQYMRLKYNHRN